ncbi:MAG: maleylpyruvate isomerase N-terminal domain-containing protein [Actinobacteria bacterium]|nr:maleylpyruvate isomerase N-terminal domain-containing protein [Actinomycetota bacterium]
MTEDTDVDSDFNRAIRQRAMESAPDGAEDFAFDWAETAARVTSRLDVEPADRLVQVYGGHGLTLDDYLITRLVEVVVHLDDLAVSLDLAPPDLPAAATGLVIDTLVAVARARHGDTAVVRALTRRERDTVEALRVL